jgi:5-methyltetrahydrofolate--homocysteine methyltransferase
MFEDIYNSILDGKAANCVAGVRAALAGGHDPSQILNEGMIAAMTKVGQMFQCGEYYVPEMLVAARAMQSGLKELRPSLVAADIKPIAKMVIGTVTGDMHDIGKNLVMMMLEGAGFEVVDLGVDVAPEKFVQAIQEHHPRFLGMSALLTTTMPMMEKTIEALKTAQVRDQVIVVVGGAPVTESFAKQIGADLFAADASSAAVRVKSFIG